MINKNSFGIKVLKPLWQPVIEESKGFGSQTIRTWDNTHEYNIIIMMGQGFKTFWKESLLTAYFFNLPPAYADRKWGQGHTKVDIW